MANRWENSGWLYFGGSKITADDEYSHGIKMLTPWKGSYDQPRQHINSRDITLLTKVCLVKATVFPVVMYECESPTMRKAECRRIDAFELWCWRTLKEIQPVNPKRNQSWIFIRRIDADAEAPILWPPDVKSWLFGKDPDAGKDWGQDWMASLAEWAWVWASSRRWWRTGKPGVLQPMGSQRVGLNWATEQQHRVTVNIKCMSNI